MRAAASRLAVSGTLASTPRHAADGAFGESGVASVESNGSAGPAGALGDPDEAGVGEGGSSGMAGEVQELSDRARRAIAGARIGDQAAGGHPSVRSIFFTAVEQSGQNSVWSVMVPNITQMLPVETAEKLSCRARPLWQWSPTWPRAV